MSDHKTETLAAADCVDHVLELAKQVSRLAMDKGMIAPDPFTHAIAAIRFIQDRSITVQAPEGTSPAEILAALQSARAEKTAAPKQKPISGLNPDRKGFQVIPGGAQ